MDADCHIREGIAAASVWDALLWYASTGQCRPGSLEFWVQRYLEQAHASGRRPTTLAGLRSLLTRVCAEHGARSPGELRPEQIRRFLWQWPHTSTRRRQFHSLATFYRWLKQQGAVLGNPVVAAMAAPRNTPLPKIIYSPDEARALLRESRNTDHLGYWVLSLFTGMRSAEIQRLGASPACWSWIHLERRVIELTGWMTKTAPRIVPLNPTAIEWLRLLDEQRLFPRNGAAKLAAFSASVLGRNRDGSGVNAGRRSFITYSLSLANASYRDTAKAAGNSETVIRRFYLQPKQRTAALIYFGLTPRACL